MNTIFAYNNLETTYLKIILTVNHNLNSIKYTTSQKKTKGNSMEYKPILLRGIIYNLSADKI